MLASALLVRPGVASGLQSVLVQDQVLTALPEEPALSPHSCGCLRLLPQSAGALFADAETVEESAAPFIGVNRSSQEEPHRIGPAIEGYFSIHSIPGFFYAMLPHHLVKPQRVPSGHFCDECLAVTAPVLGQIVKPTHLFSSTAVRLKEVKLFPGVYLTPRYLRKSWLVGDVGINGA